MAVDLKNEKTAAGPRVPLDQVIISDQLHERPTRPADFAAESAALLALVEEMAKAEGDVLQLLADTALRLCRAGSAGISLLENEDGETCFRWRAVSGTWSCYLGGTMPWHSPCGTVVERNATQLMASPERHFACADGATPPIAEALLIPFQVEGRTVGTVWVIAHEPGRHFDAEDARLMTNLGHCAALAYRIKEAQQQLSESEQTVRKLLAEVNHRSKNMLATVQAIASHLGARAESMDAFKQAFQERLQGLAAAQDLVLRAPVDTIRFDEIVRSQLSHYADLIGTRILVEGPPIAIIPAAAQLLGMAIHELSMNAAKHGALASDAGIIAVRWGVLKDAPGEDAFELTWSERVGRPIAPPEETGFGTLVLTQMLERGLDGTASLSYPREGVLWRLRVPLGTVAGANRQKGARVASAAEREAAPPVTGDRTRARAQA